MLFRKNNTKLFFILFSIISIMIFDSCLKKGEDDPSISLRSRRARVAGDWEVVSYKFAQTETLFNSYHSTTYTMNGSTYTAVYTDNGTTTDTSGVETWTWKFKRNGSFEFTQIIDGQTMTGNGYWEFSGKTKAESQIYFTGTNTNPTTPPNPSIYSGWYYDIVFYYDLKELRNKKMVWVYKSSYTEPAHNGSLEIEIEFKAK